MRYLLCLIGVCVLSSVLCQDRTVGLVSRFDNVSDGFVLFSPAGNTSTYLVNNCGELVNEWKSDYFPGNSVYLRADGSIYRASRVEGARLGEPGVGGRVERISWDSEVLWSFEYANDTVNQHHDFQLLPSGNILMVAWKLRTFEEAVANGRDPETLSDNELWPDHIVEIEPIGNDDGRIVWEWDSWDHLIQDFDESKENFGIVGDHPEKIDINYRMNDGADWHHINSINYSSSRKEIILSSPFFDEIWIIDHDISTEEARGPAGDLLYRWGNPATYKQGDETDQTLFFQHTAQWLGGDLTQEDEIIIYNNGRGRLPEEYSDVIQLNPFDVEGSYNFESGVFGPESAAVLYEAPLVTDLYSSFISGAQLLPNGHVLVCDGPKGNVFEVDVEKEIIWDYVNPISTTRGVQSQGDPAMGNLLFRAIRYPENYGAFVGRSMEGIGFIEGDGALVPFCEPLGSETDVVKLSLYPNPARDELVVSGFAGDFYILDIRGKIVTRPRTLSNRIDISDLGSGVYFFVVDDLKVKFVKK